MNGNIVKKTAPNGDTEADVFDALNRATSETAQTGSSVSLFTYTYGYDLVGNVLTVAENYPSGLNDRLVTNTYDVINRLQVEAVTGSAPNATTTYAYDPANNRMSKTITGTGATTVNYSYNNLNQLTGYTDNTGRSVALVYDYDGNRTTRTVSGGSDNGTDNYSYDYENRLIGLVKGTGGGGAGTYAYTYDYRTRRVTRDESSAGGAVTSLVFSGGTSVQEYDNGATTPTVEYIRGSDYGGGVGGILYTIRGGTPSYTHENKRGDVVAKTDATGSLTYQAQYEAFGKQVATAGSTLDRQKSNSKDTDPTGLVDEGMRYRDLETGMFINRDPAGFVDGPNLYSYVIQNPWTKFDPEGLDDQDANAKKDWNHGIPQSGEAADLAKKSGVNIDDKKWGTMLPKDAHQSASGGGIHSNSYVDENGNLVPKGKLDNGKNRNWNNEWDEWADEYNKAGKTPTEAEFSAQYNKMRNEEYYKEAFSRGTAATADYGKAAGAATEAGEAAGAAGELSEAANVAGKVLKKAGPIGVAVSVIGFAADAHAEGVNQAALNATASATGYDVTVKPVGDWTNKTFDQAQKGQLNPQNPVGNQVNTQVQMENFDPNDPSTYPK